MMGKIDESNIDGFLGAARELLIAFLARLESENAPLFTHLQRVLPDGYGVLVQFDEVAVDERAELLDDEELDDPVEEGLRQEVLADLRTKPDTVAAVLVLNVLITLELKSEVEREEEDRITDSLAEAWLQQLGYDPRDGSTRPG